MEKEYRDLLSLKEYYIIRSSKTKKPFLDTEYNCYLFETMNDANKFVNTHKDLYFDPCSFLQDNVFITEFYSYGINNIIIKTAKGDLTSVPLKDETGQKKQFYNISAQREILRLKQTGEKKYVRNLKNNNFIIPLKISERHKQMYPFIKYGIAVYNNKSYYIAFTTVQEFDSWNHTQNYAFQPLLISFEELSKLKKKGNILINPLSEVIPLTNEQLIECNKKNTTKKGK